MEHAHNVIVADGAFAWDDLGSWTALGRHLKADPEATAPWPISSSDGWRA